METWRQHIPLIQSGYADELLKKTDALRKSKSIFPASRHVFHALKLLRFDDVKIVLLGQDPYHGKGQAHGLAFSVPDGVNAPPSLKNIFKEISTDIHKGKDKTFPTDLTPWARQGVLLLNATLTVEEGKPGSHKKKGWDVLTDQIISELSLQRANLVFMLWGAHAAAKKPLIDPTNHLILEAPHPSPLSAYRGFFGCRHFSRANRYIKKHGGNPVEW